MLVYFYFADLGVKASFAFLVNEFSLKLVTVTTGARRNAIINRTYHHFSISNGSGIFFREKRMFGGKNTGGKTNCPDISG